jgi:Tol biopolymer transport system component
LWISDTTGDHGTDIAPPSGVTNMIAWAGDRVLYTTDTGDHLSIKSLVPERNTAEEVVSTGGGPGATSDGRTILYTVGVTADLWKADHDGLHAERLVSGPVATPVVTGDDREVIFLTRRDGQQTAWIVPLAGGNPRPLTTMVVSFPTLDVSQDGASMVFGSFDREGRPITLTCDLPACATPRRVPALDGHSAITRWMPDGRTIGYLDFATPSNIWAAPLDSGLPRQLTRFSDPSIRLGDFHWSRDGRLAVARFKTTNDIVLFKGLKR